MKKLLLIGAFCAALSGGAGAQAADECDGLMVCVPIAGPWVAVPTGTSVPRPRVEYQLTCPRGYVVGGVDARLSGRGIDVTFIGKLGSPINPGITTGRSVTFVASYVGTTVSTPSFRPFIGCMPASGGGGGLPTAVGVVKPGEPTVRRVESARVRPGSRTVASGCRRGEQLVDASHAFAFRTAQPPSASVIGMVNGTRTVRGQRVVVSARGDAELGRIRAIVQVHAVCSRVR
ncbi:MAG TPA: hypothetical protein VG144_12250 [Gaiellaceae bacterium]|nr:hypothetical protein [Gaiellaceae bacterium]